MRSQLKYGILFLLCCIGCERWIISPENGEEDIIKLTDGFCFQFGDSVLITHEEIDYYDYSTHMVYLKESHEILDNYNWDLANMSFSVYANKGKVYTGSLFPGWSSSIPVGPYIDFPFFYPDYVIKINHSSVFYNYPEYNKPDPRGAQAIIDALETYGQYHAGLSVLINGIDIKPSGDIAFNIKITNNDSFNYYILSPERMGIGLFHYFTNGLSFSNDTVGWLNHQCEVISPDPWDSWNMDWLDLIESGETKTYQIQYSAFDTIPSGSYRVSFHFPGLRNVAINEIDQSNGRIWMGGITTRMELLVH